MKIIIRQAEASDSLRWEQIRAAGWEYAYRGILDDEYLEAQKKKFLSRINDRSTMFAFQEDHCYLVAVDESGEVVGTMGGCMAVSETGDKVFELKGLYNDPRYIGCGIGKKLMLEFAEWVAKNGGEKFIVGCLEKNKSRGFYEKMGGIVFKTVPFRHLAKEVFFEFDVPMLIKKYGV